MGLLTLFFHLVGFVLPALALGMLLPFLAGLFISNSATTHVWYAQFAINFAVGVATLLAGLLFFGRDGKMATYAVLVLAMASSQWVLLRGWR